MNLSVPVIVLIICFAIFLIISQIAVFYKKTFIKYLSTPLVTFFICCIAVIGFKKYGSGNEWLIPAALGLSLIADILLMLEEVNLLEQGLIFFLGTHILYILFFSEWFQFQWSDIAVGLLLVAIAAGLIYLFHKEGKLGKMLLPVIVYVSALSLIVFFSVHKAIGSDGTAYYLRATGAVMFFLSDVILGWNEFAKPIPQARIFVWTFYAPGQLLIALSLFY